MRLSRFRLRAANLLLLALTTLSAFAVTASPCYAYETDSQLWTLLTFNARFHKLRLYTEVQPRIGEGYSRSAQLILRPAVGYQISRNTSVWFGYAWVPNFTPEFNNEDRYFQQYLVEDRFPNLEMINRTRLEQRAIAKAGDISLRLRHMLRLSRPLDAKRRWAAVISDELFWNLNTTPNGPEAGFDQNRLYIGLAYNTSPRARVELGYLANFLNPPRNRPDKRLDVLVLSFNYNL